MTEREWLAQQFEENRGHLRGIAYRMLGSLSEADDAVQEAWLRLNRSDADSIENLGGWLTSAPGGHLFRALTLKIKDGKIAEIEIIADPARLRDLDLAALTD